jgi:hypothetical protein
MAPFEIGQAINCFSLFYVFAVANFYPPWTLIQFIPLRPDETQDLTAIQGCISAISARIAVSIYRTEWITKLWPIHARCRPVSCDLCSAFVQRLSFLQQSSRQWTAYFSDCTLQLGKMYSATVIIDKKQIQARKYYVYLDFENQSAYLNAYEIAYRNVC